MLYQPSTASILIFGLFVAFTLGLSFYLARRAKSAASYFAAGGSIPWFINGVAFAGDYLSAASFLGICGMIAFYGYDGFLYSIGYLAGWVVALFVIAEPIKRMGKFTFADALDARFGSRGIKLAAAISTLAVSLFYLIPQMVGAGALIKPLFGLPSSFGVILVGGVVIFIVVTAGMVSTTYVQFLKGGLLVGFSLVLTILILNRGLVADSGDLKEQLVTKTWDGKTLIDGWPQGTGPGEKDLQPVGKVVQLPGGVPETGSLGPFEFFATLQQSQIGLWRRDDQVMVAENGDRTIRYFREDKPGKEVLRPGNHKIFEGLRKDSVTARVDFLSLMLALFAGTASLPHILIRYYTVKDQAAARKSTVVGIGSIGFFYVLTLFLGLGAMTSGALDVTDENMAAPLLARSFSETLFALISAIAFTTVLGTVSGLILASCGAVVHDVMVSVLKMEMTDVAKVRWGKMSAVVVGSLAIVLGILFQGMNASFLVGWAFSVAASANLPALVMALFWKGATKQGITAAIVVGMVSSLGWILLSGETYQKIYGLPAAEAPMPFSQPGIVTIPLGFVVLVVVSWWTRQPAQPHVNQGENPALA